MIIVEQLEKCPAISKDLLNGQRKVKLAYSLNNCHNHVNTAFWTKSQPTGKVQITYFRIECRFYQLWNYKSKNRDSKSWEVEMGRRNEGNGKGTALLILQNRIETG